MASTIGLDYPSRGGPATYLVPTTATTNLDIPSRGGPAEYLADVSAESATGTPTLPQLIATGIGVQTQTSTGVDNLSQLVAAASGQAIESASGSDALSQLVAASDGLETQSATGTPTLPQLVVASDGNVSGNSEDASGTPSLPQLVALGDGLEVEDATSTGTPSLSQLIASGSEITIISASGTPTLPQLSAQGAAQEGSVSSDGVPTLPQLIALATASANSELASGTPILPQLITNNFITSGFSGNAATADVTLPLLVALGAAVHAEDQEFEVDELYIDLILEQAYQSKYAAITIYTRTAYGIFVHNPWPPYQRLKDITHKANNINRSYERMATGHGSIELSNSFVRYEKSLQQGNLLVVVSQDQPTWAGPMLVMTDTLQTGIVQIDAVSMANLMESRTTPQAEAYKKSVGSHLIYRNLIHRMNARGHTGIELGVVEAGPSVSDFAVGGQSIAQALEQLHNSTNWEWALRIEATAGSIRTYADWLHLEGEDLSTKVHLWHGVHIIQAELKKDLSQGKVVQTMIGGFGKPMIDRTSITRSGYPGQQRDLGYFYLRTSNGPFALSIDELPASLRIEKAEINVLTESATDIARETQRAQERQLAQENTIHAIITKAYANSIRVGNIVSMHAPLGHVGDLDGPVRITAVQPDDELGHIEINAEIQSR